MFHVYADSAIFAFKRLLKMKGKCRHPTFELGWFHSKLDGSQEKEVGLLNT